MRVYELIQELQQFDSDTEVVGTWEGITTVLEVYQADDGRVMLDVDGGFYRERWQKEGGQ